MKAILCLLVGLTVSLACLAQTQEMEQLRLDLEKLAQLKLMLTEMKSGYQTLVNGYNAVRDVGKANFTLHQQFLENLLRISPAVMNSPMILAIDSNQQRVLASAQQLLTRLQGSGVFGLDELSDLKLSCRQICDRVRADRQLLQTVLSPGLVRMSDAERLSLIGRIQTSIQNQDSKLEALSKQTGMILLLRMQQKRDASAIRQFTRH